MREGTAQGNDGIGRNAGLVGIHDIDPGTTAAKFGLEVKQVKSLVKVTFTDKRPRCFWQEINASEYGFWANVNPAVDHPRWSQAHERLLGSNETVPTQIYNGYGDFVASLASSLSRDLRRRGAANSRKLRILSGSRPWAAWTRCTGIGSGSKASSTTWSFPSATGFATW